MIINDEFHVMLNQLLPPENKTSGSKKVAAKKHAQDKKRISREKLLQSLVKEIEKWSVSISRLVSVEATKAFVPHFCVENVGLGLNKTSEDKQITCHCPVINHQRLTLGIDYL